MTSAAPLSFQVRAPRRVVAERLGHTLFALMIFFSSFAFIEPSPYDLLAPLTIALWLAMGTRISVHHLVLIFALLFYNLGGFISLIPVLDDKDAVVFTVLSLYLAITGLFFAMFFRTKTEQRIDLAMICYCLSCVLAALCGIAGYFDLGGSSAYFSLYDRASGTFKDPNVFGSFLVPGVIYLVHALLLGRTRHPLLVLGALLVIVLGVLLSFSRGSWGALIFGTGLMMAITFLTAGAGRTRRRIGSLGLLTIAAGFCAVVAILSVPQVSELFERRASVTQDYDEGETGRFGNQRRAIPMLLERPNGFGPVQFRNIFPEDPHNTYINAFASYGWLGGFSFVFIVLSTGFVGFRLCFSPSPYRIMAQMAFPALLIYFLQGFQIDIDHWRHVYLFLGMVWGLEAARRDWLTAQTSCLGKDAEHGRMTLHSAGRAHITPAVGA